MSWMSFLPPSSAGCALPAITSWTGRSGSSSSRLSRSGSRIISVRRLYDAARRANPMVSTSGSKASSIQASSALAAPRLVHDLARRRRASSTSRWRSTRLVDHTASPGIESTTSQKASTSSESGATPARAASSKTSRPTQVGPWTPLVMEPIGTSASSKAGQSPWNIPRETCPCSWETPLARWARRKPMTAMLNTAGSPPS